MGADLELGLRRQAMLTDERWAALEPLIEACRPHAKVPPRHRQRDQTPKMKVRQHDQRSEATMQERAAADV